MVQSESNKVRKWGLRKLYVLFGHMTSILFSIILFCMIDLTATQLFYNKMWQHAKFRFLFSVCCDNFEKKTTYFASDFKAYNANIDATMCSKKCAALTFLFIFVGFDLALNLILMTNGLTSINNYFLITSFADTVIDIYAISILRDLFLLIISFIVSIHHRIIHSFIRNLHRKYISAILCLLMYSYAMIKLLIHVDSKQNKKSGFHVFLCIWNIIAAFLFFITWYALSLLKLFDYKKTNVDGGENENGDENDIFLGKRLFSYL